jgi:hypothetical protein
MTFTIASTYLAILLLCIVTLISANGHIPQFSDNTLQDSNNNVEENVEISEVLFDDDEEVGGPAEELFPIEVSKPRINATLTLTERMKSHFYIVLSQQNSRNPTSW